MKKDLSLTNKYPVYPGEYIQMPETEALLVSLQANQSGSKPLVNVEESKDCYTVEVFIPGSRREDIFLNIDKNILSIVALQHNAGDMTRKMKH
jgi:HSP20 family protein